MKNVHSLQSAAMRKRMEALIDRGVTAEKLVVESGVSKRELKAWLDGLESAAVEAKLGEWLEGLDQESESKVGWIDTPTTQKITEAMEFARTEPTISVIYGVPGVGKTIAAEHFVNEANAGTRPRCVYVMASQFVKTPTAILSLLAERLNAFGRSYRGYELLQCVADKLAPGCLIVVDEAQHLSTDALDGLRWFLDDRKIGICYLGNEVVYTRIAGGARRALFAQLHSRVGKWVSIPMPTEADTDAILEAWGIRGREERAYAHQVANQPGGLRSLSNILKQSRVAARLLKRPVDLGIMQGTAERHGLEV